MCTLQNAFTRVYVVYGCVKVPTSWDVETFLKTVFIVFKK